MQVSTAPKHRNILRLLFYEIEKLEEQIDCWPRPITFELDGTAWRDAEVGWEESALYSVADHRQQPREPHIYELARRHADRTQLLEYFTGKDPYRTELLRAYADAGENGVRRLAIRAGRKATMEADVAWAISAAASIAGALRERFTSRGDPELEVDLGKAVRNALDLGRRLIEYAYSQPPDMTSRDIETLRDMLCIASDGDNPTATLLAQKQGIQQPAASKRIRRIKEIADRIAKRQEQAQED